jgi:hypothetical protein
MNPHNCANDGRCSWCGVSCCADCSIACEGLDGVTVCRGCAAADDPDSCHLCPCCILPCVPTERRSEFRQLADTIRLQQDEQARTAAQAQLQAFYHEYPFYGPDDHIDPLTAAEKVWVIGARFLILVDLENDDTKAALVRAVRDVVGDDMAAAVILLATLIGGAPAPAQTG